MIKIVSLIDENLFGQGNPSGLVHIQKKDFILVYQEKEDRRVTWSRGPGYGDTVMKKTEMLRVQCRLYNGGESWA